MHAKFPCSTICPAQLDSALVQNRPAARSESQARFWDAPSTAAVPVETQAVGNEHSFAPAASEQPPHTEEDHLEEREGALSH